MMQTQQWQVAGQEAGQRLDRYLKQKLEGLLSLSQVRWAIEHGYCSVNQKGERFVSAKLQVGNRVTLNLPVVPPRRILLQWDTSRILFEDPFFFAYDKPAGIACDEKELFHQAKQYCKTVIPLHRLDKETTGVLLFAKEQKGADQILLQFKNRLIKKKYLAIVDREPKQNQGVISNYLVRKQAHSSQSLWSVSPTQKGLYAETAWQKVAQGSGGSIVECFPKTGRTHQIRVHLSSIGHPILGDPIYLRQSICPYKPLRLLLHACSLQWQHPQMQKEMVVHAALPHDLLEAIAYIKKG